MGECCFSRRSASSNMRRDRLLNPCPGTWTWGRGKNSCSRFLISKRSPFTRTVNPTEARAFLAALLQRARLTRRRYRVDESIGVLDDRRPTEIQAGGKLLAMPFGKRCLSHYNADVMLGSIVDKLDVWKIGQRFAVEFNQSDTA